MFLNFTKLRNLFLLPNACNRLPELHKLPRIRFFTFSIRILRTKFHRHTFYTLELNLKICSQHTRFYNKHGKKMMNQPIRWLLMFAMSATSVMVTAEQAKAGPLLDWLLGRNRRACHRQAFRPSMPACGTCTTTCQQTCQRVVVNYVPCTAYRTQWEQVPVTQYRQTTSTDPCTGCTTTCMKPCTTNTWRMRRVPYTTYRPVYRTETYRVPVTYTTPAMDTGCSSCAVGTNYGGPNYGVQGATVVNPNGLNLNGQYQPNNQYYSPTPADPTTGAPADNAPQLNSGNLARPTNRVMASSSQTAPSHVPVYPTVRPEGQEWSTNPELKTMEDPEPNKRWDQNSAPALLNDDSYTSVTPAIRKWDYTPVRTASYTTTAKPVVEAKPVQQSKPAPVKKQLSPGWKSVGW